jgi:hypothetical protein
MTRMRSSAAVGVVLMPSRDCRPVAAERRTHCHRGRPECASAIHLQSPADLCPMAARACPSSPGTGPVQRHWLAGRITGDSALALLRSRPRRHGAAIALDLDGLFTSRGGADGGGLGTPWRLAVSGLCPGGASVGEARKLARGYGMEAFSGLAHCAGEARCCAGREAAVCRVGEEGRGRFLAHI